MRRWVSTSASAMLIAAAFAAMGTGVSFAGSDPVTLGDGAMWSDSQVPGASVPGLVAAERAVPVEGAASADGIASGQNSDTPQVDQRPQEADPLNELASVLGLNLGL
ncbi:hypothetical protein HNR23_005034 [Nocardiopsis mwathae]|uniref:Uncharacterized protein n=1 Tax=Nocardiopsis mwathae TaxID=1472723 RepID=A0A7W9YMZ2_9ACTN|nr:hypothetical protein [Nocardiopsis mwathae]MBB6174974.1 hypothetical protein [Nocardiopsis mwathae]